MQDAGVALRTRSAVLGASLYTKLLLPNPANKQGMLFVKSELSGNNYGYAPQLLDMSVAWSVLCTCDCVCDADVRRRSPGIEICELTVFINE